MNISYRSSSSFSKPESIEIHPDYVYLRKDIHLETRFFGEDELTIWVYEEAVVSRKEFDSEVSAMLISGQQTGEDDRLSIMESIADLYDILSNLV